MIEKKYRSASIGSSLDLHSVLSKCLKIAEGTKGRIEVLKEKTTCVSSSATGIRANTEHTTDVQLPELISMAKDLEDRLNSNNLDIADICDSLMLKGNTEKIENE